MSRPLTPLGLAVLHLLQSEPMHPYEMQQRIRDHAIDKVVKVAHGSLYHAVARLAEGGLIEPVETSREGRRPERTVYAITEKGRDEALSRLRDFLLRPMCEFPEFGMALAFISMLPPEEAVVLLDRRSVLLEAEARQARHRLRRSDQAGSGPHRAGRTGVPQLPPARRTGVRTRPEQ